MSRSYLRKPTLPSSQSITTRLGTSGSSNNYSAVDQGKFVKLIGESAYGLCAAGDRIEAVITAVEQATAGGYSIGSVNEWDAVMVTFDGLQATPGTGAIAVGDYVVCGTVVARGTDLTAPPKVCKATNQPGATVTSSDNVVGNINAAIAKVVDAQMNSLFAWRVVSLGSVGTGAVGTVGLIARAD